MTPTSHQQQMSENFARDTKQCNTTVIVLSYPALSVLSLSSSDNQPSLPVESIGTGLQHGRQHRMQLMDNGFLLGFQRLLTLLQTSSTLPHFKFLTDSLTSTI